jgi:predicted NBD/HSP70 family sugar kinase
VSADGHVKEPLGSAGHLRLSVPTVSARVSFESLASTLVRMIASGAAVTRAELVRQTGLARSSVTDALLILEQAGITQYGGVIGTTGRGRPAESIAINPDFGLVLVANLGVRRARLSIHDVGQRVLDYRDVESDIRRGPEPVMAELVDAFTDMLVDLERDRHRRLVMVLGLPGPVDTSRGVAVKPPIMPGWDDYPIADRLAERLGCPVLCENNVNLLALGEARALDANQSPLLYVNVSTGIGGGLVTNRGELYHGADGAAGDIGHIRVASVADVQCACGNFGCIETVASAPAVLRQVQALGAADAPGTLEQLYESLRANDRVSVGAVREAATHLGEVVANLVHFYNPARVVVGGALTVPSDDMLAGIRAVVYHRALPLATRNLVITKPVLAEWSGTAGGVVIGTEYALTPDGIYNALDKARGRRVKHTRWRRPGAAPRGASTVERPSVAPTGARCRVDSQRPHWPSNAAR